MRDQFAGDISDLRKFAFLRAVIPQNMKLGVAWYYNANHDGTAAGKHLEHITQTKWLSLDPIVHEALSQLKDRKVEALEQLQIWPNNTIFHREIIPKGLKRSLWARQMYEAIESADVIFIDPDNGLGATSELHATLDEVEILGRKNRPVITIQFPHRNAKYPQQLEELHQLFEGHSITTVMTSVWVKQPRATWFNIINATEQMNESAKDFTESFNSIEHAKAEIHISIEKS